MGSELNIGGINIGGGLVKHASLDNSSITLSGGTGAASGGNITLTGSGYGEARTIILKSNSEEIMRIDNISGATFAAGIVSSAMPESDPSVAGKLWNDSGTVKISSG